MTTSLHTKHRPSSFEEVVGQESVIRSLKRVVEDKRAKSFIFTGPSGTGKTTLARILANEFAGKDATVANVEEFPAAEKSGADDVRAVVARTVYRAIGKSPIKAVIVDECHRLSNAAWNVLLKPIEEPPAHVYWMLCTTEPSKIPKTIVTRCLRYDLKPVREDLILELLCKVADTEKLETSDQVLEAIAENAEGSPRQALVFLETCAYCENANEARVAMRTAGQTKNLADLCRFLLQGRGHTWPECLRYVKALEGADAESIRISIVNYFAAVLMNTKSDREAKNVLGLLECFERPYNQSDKMAPLLMSLGLALGLDG